MAKPNKAGNNIKPVPLAIAIQIEPDLDERKRHLALQVFYLKVKEAMGELERKFGIEETNERA